LLHRRPPEGGEVFRCPVATFPAALARVSAFFPACENTRTPVRSLLQIHTALLAVGGCSRTTARGRRSTETKGAVKAGQASRGGTPDYAPLETIYKDPSNARTRSLVVMEFHKTAAAHRAELRKLAASKWDGEGKSGQPPAVVGVFKNRRPARRRCSRRWLTWDGGGYASEGGPKGDE